MAETPTDPAIETPPQSEPTPELDVEAARRELAAAEAELAAAEAEYAKLVRYCKNCETNVEPVGKGQCPVCKCFLPGNVGNLIHGGRRMDLPAPFKSRRAELKKQVWADLGDLSPIMAEVAEDFVSACVMRDQLIEHLEAIGPLTNRGARRAAMDLYLATSARIERLSAVLADYRQAHPAAPAPPLDAVPVPTLVATKTLLARLANGEELTEREHGQLDVLRSAIRGEVALPADGFIVPEPGDPGYAAFEAHPPAAPPVRNDEVDARASNGGGPDPRPAPKENAPPTSSVVLHDTRCAYCHLTPCVGRDHHAYDILHAEDPEHVEARTKKATAEMLHQLGRVTW